MSMELKKSGRLGIITLENIGKFNALDESRLKELQTVLDACEIDSAISVLILTGKGTMFCAGFDVSEIYQLSMSDDRELADAQLKELRNIVEHLASYPKGTVAVIDGVCLGGGLELALACNARIASERARFGFPEISLGLIPGLGGTQRLPRLVPIQDALKIMLAGQGWNFLSAKDALSIGLVDEVVPASNLISMAKQYAQKMQDGTFEPKTKAESIDVSVLNNLPASLTNLAKDKPARAVEALISAVRANQGPLEAGLATEHKLFLDLLFTEEARRAMRRSLKIPEPSEEKPQDVLTASASQEQNFQRIPFVTYVPEEYKMLRELVRDFAKKRVAPQVASMEEQRAINPELIREMAQLGFFGASFAEEYGGAGMSRHAVHIIVEELARVHASLAVVYGAHTGLSCGAINLWGNEAQKQKYLIPAIAGEKIGALL